MLHQTFIFLGQLRQLFEVSQILEFLRYVITYVGCDISFDEIAVSLDNCLIGL